MDQFFLRGLLQPFFCSRWLSTAPSVLIHTSIAHTRHSLTGAMHICSFELFADSQRCCNILKVTLSGTLLQIWVFLSNTNIAWRAEQCDEKCRIRARVWQEGRELVAHFGPWKNTWDSLWSSKRRQPAGLSSGPSQNDCYKTGQACWEHWCLFSSQPHSITWPSSPDAPVCPPVFFASLALSVILRLLLLLNILLDFVSAAGRMFPDLCTIEWTQFFDSV